MKLSFRIRLLNEYLKLFRATMRDMRRYARHACIGWNRGEFEEGQLEGRIIANYHVLEKGLSMPDFRPFFGIPMVKGLIAMVRKGTERFKWCENVNYHAACLALRAYSDKHRDLGLELEKHFSPDEISFFDQLPDNGDEVLGGARLYRKDRYFEDSYGDFAALARSRHSCRSFDPSVEVEMEKLRSAIEIARNSPSVCNRQCWRLHIYREKIKVEELLALQEGNRGFGHTVPVVLVVTAGLQVFDGFLERNQAYIDGGLFSMSLMYALHHQEIGCVPLCWLAPADRDDELRRIAEIPDDEVVLMFLGVGVPTAEFSAPVSQRRSVGEFTIVH